MKEIPIELLEKVVNYLATRPFLEVHQLIQELMKLQDAEKAKK